MSKALTDEETIAKLNQLADVTIEKINDLKNGLNSDTWSAHVSAMSIRILYEFIDENLLDTAIAMVKTLYKIDDYGPSLEEVLRNKYNNH